MKKWRKIFWPSEKLASLLSCHSFHKICNSFQSLLREILVFLRCFLNFRSISETDLYSMADWKISQQFFVTNWRKCIIYFGHSFMKFVIFFLDRLSKFVIFLRSRLLKFAIFFSNHLKKNCYWFLKYLTKFTNRYKEIKTQVSPNFFKNVLRRIACLGKYWRGGNDKLHFSLLWIFLFCAQFAQSCTFLQTLPHPPKNFFK